MQTIPGFPAGVNEEVTVAGKQAALLTLALLNQDRMVSIFSKQLAISTGLHG